MTFRTHRATTARSVRLLRAFRDEPADPERFYGLLARDTVAYLRRHADLKGAVAADVGSGPGYLARALRAAGARCVGVEYDAGEGADGVLGDALALPLRSGSVDVCLSSNVLEHVAEPWRMCDEMVRVTRDGGLVYLAFTNWLSPWGGHETSPWHLFGGDYAARRYERKNGRPPKNRFGESMFALGATPVLKLARSREDVTVLEARPRYYPRWCGFLMRLPVLRDLLGWNLMLVLRRDS